MRRFLVVALMAACLSEIVADPRQPTTLPLLRINTEMHTSAVWALDTDSDGRYLLTVSGDATARLWDLSDGSLIRVFRPPIDAELRTLLTGCALSPDGDTAIVGGHAGFDWSSEHFLYVFDSASGTMERSIGGFPAPIQSIAYARSGRILAVGLRNGGIRILDADSWTQRFALDECSAACVGISFDSAGRLAALCADGSLRIYDASFQTSVSAEVAGGRWPQCVSLAPDGRRVAVGFYDSSVVEIYSGEDLRRLASVSGRSAIDGAHFALSWSADGEVLYGGGWSRDTYDGRWLHCIEQFGPGEMKVQEKFPASVDTIFDIRVLPDGGLVFCSAPDIGRISRSGKEVFVRRGDTLRFNGRSHHLRTNNDGTVVGFGPLDAGPFVFDASRLVLSPGQSDGAAPRMSAGDVAVTDMQPGPPRVNNIEATCFEARERCHAVSVAPDGQSVILGADWHIYCLDPSAEVKWQIPARTAWAVNVAANNRVFVAAYGDGTIGWHRLSDGARLMSLFVHSDGERWIAWTPEGYFASSKEGSGLAGWHVNNGLQRASLFYPLSRFTETYLRPDVVARVPQSLSVQAALRAADVARDQATDTIPIVDLLPPVTSILEPMNGARLEADRLAVELVVSWVPENPAEEVWVTVDSSAGSQRYEVPIEPAMSDGADRVTVNLDVPSGRYTIEAAASNQAGFGDPARVSVTYVKPAVPERRLNLLSVARSGGAAGSGARRFVEKLSAQGEELFTSIEAQLLTGGHLSNATVVESLRRITEHSGPQDVSVLYLVAEERIIDGDPFVLIAGQDSESGMEVMLAANELSEVIADVPGPVAVFFDVSPSADDGTVAASLPERTIELLGESGAVVVAFAEGQSAGNGRGEGGGVLGDALVEGLDGSADYTGDGTITFNELEIYARKRILGRAHENQRYVDYRPLDMRDFPVASVNNSP